MPYSTLLTKGADPMKILSLHIDGFGKFHDRDISFEDGLNVVYGKNEAGNPLYIHLSRACSLALSAAGPRF